ncbi:hypothetical protein BDV36DRAFT_210219 [Aspergillus pseudocaelatus]|uniref:Zn(2)-C6 fungal-type domain-containing protein n=1 Tax=Aspergillus pseudocaelatus TaxID=1825620 RepID=A0ABQ6WZX9_9EURO|nr:hypothetical protein BDV36DRAFT_210219 [Aspergillus pseudocaelatus]
MRSYSGCLTCKRRKLKCDETKPTCRKCIKASRGCAYGEQSIFRSQEISSTPDRVVRRANRSREATTWVNLPTEFTFVHVGEPWDEESSRVTEARDATADSEDHGAIDGTREASEENQALESHPVAHDILAATPSLHHTPITAHYTPREHASPDVDANRSESEPLENVLVSYLLRHFKQEPGQWMDLFDTTSYFSSKVPVIATSKTLLKSAVCALAAKHLRHVCRVMSQAGVDPGCVPKYSGLPFSNEEMWRYHSARYYDQALGHLKVAVSSESYSNTQPGKEEMLAAVAILCSFELMDAPGSAWRAHLSALPLFDDRASSVPVHSSIIIPQTAVKGPIFWSLARQDLLCAFISETPTRLDLKDMRLWQNAGLATDDNGEILPYSPSEVLMQSQTTSGFDEDIKSNELAWILGKIANHLTAGDALVPTNNTLPRHQRPLIGLSQEHLLERWNRLMADLERWHDSLPASFTPTARTRKLGCAASGFELSFDTFDQIWFDLPLCAATMQSYHQAKILLLANEPQESTAIRSTVSARLRSYRHALLEVVHHAREVCGISLANSTDSFRVNSVQALFVAGQVFQERGEQDAVLELLSGIENDLGWTTRYHVAKLKDEWAKGRNGNHVDRDEQGQGHDSNWFIS